MTAVYEKLKFTGSRTFKALLALAAVWTLAFTLFFNGDVLAGKDVPGNGAVLKDLQKGDANTTTTTTTEIPEAVPSTDLADDFADDAFAGSRQQHDTLISYVYAESAFGRVNLEYFVKLGLHKEADFVFIFNGESTAPDMIPDWDNIKVVRRNNTCYDMGAVGEVMRTDDLWRRYKKFISINSSIRGPFLPYWSSDCWSDLYLNKISDRTKYVGLSANCFPRSHVQSMIFATDDIGMAILLDPDHNTAGVADRYGSADDPVGLSGCYSNHRAAVHSEIGMATLIINAGYDVDVMMAAFHQEDGLEAFCKKTGTGDVLYDNKYFGFNLHPYETIFFKTNRKIDPIAITRLTEWHLKQNVTSLELCAAK